MGLAAAAGILRVRRTAYFSSCFFTGRRVGWFIATPFLSRPPQRSEQQFSTTPVKLIRRRGFYLRVKTACSASFTNNSHTVFFTRRPSRCNRPRASPPGSPHTSKTTPSRTSHRAGALHLSLRFSKCISVRPLRLTRTKPSKHLQTLRTLTPDSPARRLHKPGRTRFRRRVRRHPPFSIEAR
jgi:hypothetical protein